MPIGINDISALRLTVLNKLVTKYLVPPNLVLKNMFRSVNYESDNIEWESQIGSRGLTPFAAEDAESPAAAVPGVGENSAHAAFWKERTFFGSSFLNNIREPGTDRRYQRAARTLGNQVRNLSNRSNRREEWMLAQMLCNDGFTYKDKNGVYITLDYGIPDDNKVSLGADYKWDAGTKRNIAENIFDAKLAVSNANAGVLSDAIFTSEVLKYMIFDDTIQTLLQKSSYGQGDLFANPTNVIGNLIGIANMHLYDEAYQIRAWLTTALAAGAGPHTVYVDSTVDFEVGGTLTCLDTSAKTTETLTITAVNTNAGTLTATGTLASAYKATEDYVYMTRKFVPTDKFIMWANSVDGEPIAEFMKAPHELARKWGQQIDRWEKRDPDGIFVRVEDKGLPVLYHEDAVYQLTVT
jgi:hypothetical protein